MTIARRCELTVHGPLARSMLDAIRMRFDLVSACTSHDTVLTLDTVDQAAVRAVMTMLWDCGHEVLAMSTDGYGA